MHQPLVAAIVADDVAVGDGVRIAADARIHGRRITIGDGVVIGPDVTISCDEMHIADGARIGAHTCLISPTIVIGERSAIGAHVQAELNDHLRIGRLNDVGSFVRLVGQGVAAGDHLWMTDHVVVGGGGARGPRSYLTIGDRCAVMDRCFINVSESVSIGDDTALSNGVTILTHSLWQPVLAGGTSQFAPVHIGHDCIVYVNAVVAPGITIGNHVTIAAGALVLQDVPDASTAVGNPARVMRSTPAMPRELPLDRRAALVRDALAEWTLTLPVKGVTACKVSADYITAVVDGLTMSVATCFDSTASQPATITLGFGPARGESATHFDLAARTMSGDASPLAEDLRDFLRRRTIRIYTDRPFSAIRPRNLERLRARLDAAR
jgi:acetyltransferase-like isoleucine patch superfamily enzyme